MHTIQLVLSDQAFAKRLQQHLTDNGNWPVAITEVPGFGRGGVVVLDDKVLMGLAAAPDFPDRVVLIAPNDPQIQSHAWNLGIRSVVYDTDNLSTVLLAIMSAYLRLPKSPDMPKQRVISPNAPSAILQISPKRTATGPK
jgi:hypothetical protein